MRKYSKAVVNLAITLVILLGIIILVPKLIVFFAPFVAGAIIAMIARPLVRFLEEKVRLKRKIGSAFVIVMVIALVVLVIYLVGVQLVQQVVGLISDLPEMWKNIESDLNSVGKKLGVLLALLPSNMKVNLNDAAKDLVTYLGEFFEKAGTPTIEAAGNFAKSLPSVFIGVIMALLSAYFFVAERTQISEWLNKVTPASIRLRFHLVKRSLVTSVGGYFKAQFKIEIWMYLLLVIGLGILRVDYFALIALGIACLDFFPFFGTGTVMVPWAIIKIFTADYTMAIWLLVIWGGGQLLRQLIQPKIMGDSMGVPPLPTLFLLYIGYKLAGVIGMIVAVPIGLVLYSLYQEGAFATSKNSILILVAGINKFRRLRSEDMEVVEEMSAINERVADELQKQKGQEN